MGARCSHSFCRRSRNETTITLKDGATGFGKGERKPILSFGKSHFNNHVGRNCVRNLTIDSGSGNPGAVGIHLNGANVVDISNVTIRSGDGTGVSGIDVIIPPTQSCMQSGEVMVSLFRSQPE